MIIIPIRSICLLLLTSSIVYAQEIDLTFEVMQAKIEEMPIVEKEAQKLQQKGFECHIDARQNTLSLRCNDTKDINELQKSMNAFEKNKIDYTIIYKTLQEKEHYKDPRIFHLGYKAYDRGEYKKALDIFKYNYTKAPNLEHAYGYALSLMKLNQYDNALSVLQQFNDSPKAEKLTKDIAQTYIDELTNKGKYQEAHLIVEKYLNNEKSHHKVIAQQHYNEMFNAKQYEQAKDLATRYDLSEKSDESDYMMALRSFETKEYDQSLDRLKRIEHLPKAKLLYNEVLYTVTLDKAWKLLDQDHKSALASFQEACKLKETLSCNKGMMYAYYKGQNFKRAYALAKKLYGHKKSDEFASIVMYSAKALNKTDEAKLWYEKIQNKKGITDPTIKYIVYDPRSKIASYVRQGNSYRQKGDIKALDLYKQAKTLDKNDIKLELLYLHALKDFGKYTLLDNELKKAYQMYPKDTKKLNYFKQVYDKKRLNDYYKNGQYYECLHYAKEINEAMKDDETHRIIGWCAYALQDYNEAKRQFVKITPNSSDKYAQALSSYKNGDIDEAIQTLSVIEPQNNSQRIKIASLYADLSMPDEAKKLLEKLPESAEKETLKNRINKNYFYTRYDHSQSIGFEYRTRSANDGKNSFNMYSIPLDYDYVDLVKNYHLYFDGDLMRLSTTNIDMNTNYGFNTTPWEESKKRDLGFSPKIGINYNNINAQIGLSPIGYDIDPKLLWLFSYTYTYESLRFNIAFTQKEIDDTMLSYVGEKAINPDTDETVYWGRILKQGYTASISHDMDDMIMALNMEFYPKIHGNNVMTNKEFKTTAMLLYYPDVEYFSFMQIGLLANYDSYDKNSDLYTYGHGGYFSPQDFWLGSIFTEFGDTVNERLYYQSKLSLGYQWYRVDDVDAFPLNNYNNVIQSGYTKQGITYKASLQLGYKLTENLDFLVGLSIEEMQEYTEQRASFALTYKFKPTKQRYLNTFKMNHKIDRIMK